ncbi:MAG: dodecin [Chloroflexota bacterium]
MTTKHSIYKRIQLTGTSPNSVEEAVNHAVLKASETIRHMRWFKIEEIRGVLGEDAVFEWQVNVQIGFTLED